MKFISILAVAVSFLGVSCERHDFAETRKLHEHHAAEGHDTHASKDGRTKDAHKAEH